MPSPDVERARTFFPTMPAEVFDMWIAPWAEKDGWPFTSIDQSPLGWETFLDDLPFSFWASSKWKLCDWTVRWEALHFETRQRIEWITLHCLEGIKTPTANLENTTERFRTCTAFAKVNGTIPKPLVGFWVASQLDVLDGHHRLAGLFQAGFAHGLTVPVWTVNVPYRGLLH